LGIGGVGDVIVLVGREWLFGDILGQLSILSYSIILFYRLYFVIVGHLSIFVRPLILACIPLFCSFPPYSCLARVLGSSDGDTLKVLLVHINAVGSKPRDDARDANPLVLLYRGFAHDLLRPPAGVVQRDESPLCVEDRGTG
jgi:hypothetical protein